MGLATKILPDTNVFILALKGIEPIRTKVQTWIENQQLLISPIVITEFLVGASPKEEKIFHNYLKSFPVPHIDQETAKLAAYFRKSSLQRKTRMHLPDCLIAAQCFQHQASLATFNTLDFPPEISRIDLRS